MRGGVRSKRSDADDVSRSAILVFGIALAATGWFLVRRQGRHRGLTFAHPLVKAEEAHNDYLQLVAEGGVLVAGATFFLIIVLNREILRRLRDDIGDPPALAARIGAVIGLLAISVQELVEFSLQMPANAALFVVLVALAIRNGGRNIAHSSV